MAGGARRVLHSGWEDAEGTPVRIEDETYGVCGDGVISLHSLRTANNTPPPHHPHHPVTSCRNPAHHLHHLSTPAPPHHPQHPPTTSTTPAHLITHSPPPHPSPPSLSVTAVCLTDDDSTAYSVSKDGSIFQWDIQTLTRTRLDKHRRGGAQIQNSKGDMDGVGAVGSAPWVAAPARRAGPRGGLLACAVSSDRRYLAVGGGSHEVMDGGRNGVVFGLWRGLEWCMDVEGGDGGVFAWCDGGIGEGQVLSSVVATLFPSLSLHTTHHPSLFSHHIPPPTPPQITIYDVRTHSPAGTLRGHKDAISGLAFKHNTHDLYSTSLDRSVRIWSVGAMAYADSLFGHQQEALCVDVAPGGAERALTGGMDRTVRLFKIPEESHLVFR